MLKNTSKILVYPKKTLIYQAFFLITTLICLFFSTQIFAQPTTVADWEAGSVVLVNGHRFIKLNPPGGDGYFMAMEPACYTTQANFTGEVKSLEGVEDSSNNTLQEYVILTSTAQGIGATCSWSSADPTHQITPLTPNSCTVAIPIFDFTTDFTLELSGCNLRPLTFTRPINPRPTMQAFTKADCLALPKCSGAEGNYACPQEASIELIDERDDKTYTIRRLADGNCWMVDNLAYGGASAQGDVDACAGKTTLNTNSTTTYSDIFGENTYGDCIDPAHGPMASGQTRQCGSGILTNQCGYLYNWQAVMQEPTANNGNNYTGPQENVTGLCPAGWTIPTGGPEGEPVILDKALGGTGANNQNNSTLISRWHSPSNANVVYSGNYDITQSNGLGSQGIAGYYHTSSIDNNKIYLYTISNDNNKFRPQLASEVENNAVSLRCLISFPQKPENFSFTCSPNQINLDVIPLSVDTLRWYDNETSDEHIYQGLDFSPPTPNQPITYYVASYNTKTGEESLERLAIPVSANQCATMQSFNQEKCSLLTSCTASTCYPESSLELVDERDNKVYTIRRLADRNCWMVEHLAYGGASAQGGVDACAGKTTIDVYGSTEPSNVFGAGTYGDCIDPAYGPMASGQTRQCGSGILTNQCGYLYNWQAVMQEPTANNGNTYTGPQENVTGLCPKGWTIPTGGPEGEPVILDKALGGTGANNQNNSTLISRWHSPSNANIVYSGNYDTSKKGLVMQGTTGYLYTSTEISASNIYVYTVSNLVTHFRPQLSAQLKIGAINLRCLISF